MTRIDLYSLNINKKMLLAIGLVSIVSLSVTALVTFSIVSLTVEENIKEQIVSKSIIKAETIQTFSDLKLQQVKDLAKNKFLQKYINDINRLEKDHLQVSIEQKWQEFSDEIHKFQNNIEYSLELDNLYIFGKDGRKYFSLDKDADENQLYHIYESFTKTKEPTIEFGPSTVSNDGNMVITMPVFASEENTSSEPMGTIVALVSMSEIKSILTKSFGIAGSDVSFLVNKELLIVLNSQEEENIPSITSLDTIPVNTCFEKGQNYYGKYMDFNNIQVYGFSYCMSDLNLSLITEINEYEVLHPIMDLQQSFLFIGSTVVVGIGIVSFMISRSISNPILHLRDTADKIANGNFNARSTINSGDEIEQLSISFDTMAQKIQDYLEEIKQKDTVIKEQRDLLLEFSESKQECCVGIIDIVNSTKITANLSDKDTSNFYGIFINFMASIVKEFGGIVVKNVGDALLFYFPDTDINDKQSFENVVNCCMKMIDSHSEINSKMDEKGLSSLSYRISAVYGPIMIGQMSTSSVVDIFGSTVNVCTKINSLASSNELVIGEDLYCTVKSHDRFTFKEKTNYVIDGKTKFKVYSVKHIFPPKLTKFVSTL